MNNFFTLYSYEMKKLVQRKMVWIALLICLLCIAVTVLSDVLGEYRINGEEIPQYRMFQSDKANQLALDGRRLEQSLLEETWEAYGRLPLSAEQ